MKKNKYRDYCETIDGQLYASVSIPEGNGKYKRKRKRVGSKREARQWATDQLNKSGILSGEISAFPELAEWYKNKFLVPPVYANGKRESGLRTWKTQRTVLEHLCKEFTDYDLSEIGVDLLDRYKRRERKFVSVTTVNRRFCLLRTMLKKAVSRKWMTESPFELEPSLIEVGLEPKRVSKLDTRLVKRVLARSRKSEQPLLHYVLLTLAHTGARPSEIYPYDARPGDGVLREPLTWDRVLKYNFTAVELVSYKGRIRSTRMVPVSRELEVGLRRLHTDVNPQDSDMIFNITTFKRSWGTLCRSLGLSDVRMRDLRHYFNSYLVSRPDINDMERMLILGHTKMSTNARYSKLDDTTLNKFRR